MNPNTEIDPKDLASLTELAFDMHWSWNHSADKIWSTLDPFLWQVTHNPWVVLQTMSKLKLKQALLNSEFQSQIHSLIQEKNAREKESTWFQENHSKSALNCVAYFSMEYMLSEALPIYSGGLGNVAGDQLKAASDLGVPVIAVGLLYQRGYFRQVINQNGLQEAYYPYNDPGQLPITPVRSQDGQWLRLEIKLSGWSLWVRVWQVKVGRVILYLLDSNDPANFPVQRAITSELYGGSIDLRIKQEILLGIGGWMLFEALEISPEVCHLNEGHAAFAILERARCYMQKANVSFEVALATTRAGNIFTTHTAVPAGFDRFPPELIEQYLSKYVHSLGISMHDLLALGRQNPNDDLEWFNMAYLAVRGSGGVNGVSRLHGKVSRSIFEPLFPRWPGKEIPIGYVTNGVHAPSWDSPASDELWTRFFGEGIWRYEPQFTEKEMDKIPLDQFWKMRCQNRKMLIAFVRNRLARQSEVSGLPDDRMKSVQNFFDENTLTVGFARRFATYKRPNMLLQDQARLLRMLQNAKTPIQIIIAGKAHPADEPGKEMIRQWMEFIQKPEVHGRIIFLPDYDMLVTEKMVQGVDVWLNTPRRPWEASGTSGMKVLVNGGLNLSELDGWWSEAYCPEVGWAIGDGNEHEDAAAWDVFEANALYDILEKEVIPCFYQRDHDGIPVAWVAKMKWSMGRLTLRFSSNRSVREYTENYYLPAVQMYGERAAEEGKKGKEIADWKNDCAKHWEKIRFGELQITTEKYVRKYEVQVYLDGFSPKFVKVELYAEGDEKRMELVKELVEPNLYLYSLEILLSESEPSYTVRVVPFFEQVMIPLEESHILWLR